MCLTLGFAMEDFAVLATDTMTFTSDEDGELIESQEYAGGKLRESEDGGAFMTVGGGQWCATALESGPFPDFSDEITLEMSFVEYLSTPV